MTFQIRLNNIQNCFEWTSSDTITHRVEDITSMIVSLIAKQCKCNFTRKHITNGGFKCFLGSENHVTFRGVVWETTQKSSQELIKNLETIVQQAQYWLIRGQYLQLNHSCNLIIANIHAPECSTSDADTTYPALSEPACNTTGYIIWGAVSTSMFTLFSIIASCLLIIGIRKKHFKYVLILI